MMLVFYSLVSSGQNSHFKSILTVIMETFLSESLTLHYPTAFALSDFRMFLCSCCGQKRWRCWCVEVQNLIWVLCRKPLSMKVTVRQTPPYGKIHLLPVFQHQLRCAGPKFSLKAVAHSSSCSQDKRQLVLHRQNFVLVWCLRAVVWLVWLYNEHTLCDAVILVK